MEKLNQLREKIKELKEATVSFSGGVDSSLLAKTAFDVLGDKAQAITVKTEFIPEDDIINAVNTAREIGIKHKIIHINLLEDEEITSNPEDRCYLCKLNLMEAMPGRRVLDGTNADDDDGRPGLKAIEEIGVYSPLRELGIGKEKIREMAKELNLANASRPSNSCLATRIPFNKEITKEKLSRVEKSEKVLNNHGINNVRARIYDEGMFIEVPDEYKKHFAENKEKIQEKLPDENISVKEK